MALIFAGKHCVGAASAGVAGWMARRVCCAAGVSSQDEEGEFSVGVLVDGVCECGGSGLVAYAGGG